MTDPSEETICAVCTPRGSGAVGILRLSGPLAGPLLLRCTGRRSLPPPRRLVAARVLDPERGVVLDQTLICHMPGPNSFTGEDVAEVHAHGGVLNMERLMALMVRLGARPARPGEFCRRAFQNGRMDLTQAEAVAQIISAGNEQALSNSQVILGGELGRRVRRLRQELLSLCAHLEAAVDFAEDLPEEALLPGAARLQLRAVEAIEALDRTYQRGRLLHAVPRVALVGSVNAGKSSLFNFLLEMDRALVHPSPGTTRDYIEAEALWQGQRIMLVDTAGARPEGEMTALEQGGRRLAGQVLRSCQLLLHVVDLGALPEPALPEEGPLANIPSLMVANKLDLPGAGEALSRLTSGSAPREIIATSVVTGEGLDLLRRTVLERVLPADGQGSEPLLITLERHHEALSRAALALRQGQQALERGLPPELVVEHARQAISALEEITGERLGEAVLDTVFASFCLGK